MLKFAANLSFLFKEYPLAERIPAAAQAGFNAVEILFPYDVPAPQIRRALDVTGVELVLINTPPPNWAGGDRGFAAIPGGQDRFQYDFRRALRYAQVLGARILHVMAGQASGPEAHETYLANLRWASDQLAEHAPDKILTIEPLNSQDMPGYFLNDFDLAAQILDHLNAPNLGLQFDAYHAHLITGDVMGCWAKHGHRARHIQVANAEGRHEPGPGAIDYQAFFSALTRQEYQGVVSGEYHPKGRTADGLGWREMLSG